MKSKSSTDRIIHVSFELSVYWATAFILFVLVNGPIMLESLPMTITAGVAFIIISAKFIREGIQKPYLKPDWGLIYPELNGSCYTRGRLPFRVATILQNFSIAFGIIGISLVFEENKVGIYLVCISSVMYAIYAIFEASLRPLTDYNWELVYPELSIGYENDNEQKTNNLKI